MIEILCTGWVLGSRQAISACPASWYATRCFSRPPLLPPPVSPRPPPLLPPPPAIDRLVEVPHGPRRPAAAGGQQGGLVPQVRRSPPPQPRRQGGRPPQVGVQAQPHVADV